MLSFVFKRSCRQKVLKCSIRSISTIGPTPNPTRTPLMFSSIIVKRERSFDKATTTTISAQSQTRLRSFSSQQTPQSMNGGGQQKQGEALAQYSTDLTQMAIDGKLDPVIGRHEEIRRTLQILARRTKNNPILIGEPGKFVTL